MDEKRVLVGFTASDAKAKLVVRSMQNAMMMRHLLSHVRVTCSISEGLQAL